MSKSVRAVVLAVALVLTLSTTASAARSTSTSPKRWGTTYCKAMAGWATAVGTNGQAISAAASESPDVAKAAMVAGLKKSAAASLRARHALVKAGIPDTAGGKKIAALSAGFFTKVARIYNKSAKIIAAAPVMDPAKFAAATKKAVTSLATVRAALPSAALAKADKGQKMSKILAGLTACAALSSAG